MSQLKNKLALNLILIFCIFALISAYFIQYILDHKACNLCLIERLPYIFSIIIILLALIIIKFEKFFIILLSITFISATIISFYHFGIEQGFFKESIVCTSESGIDNLSKEELLKELQNKPISCKEVTFTVFSLSLATINMIISFLLSVITLRLFFNYEKNQ